SVQVQVNTVGVLAGTDVGWVPGRQEAPAPLVPVGVMVAATPLTAVLEMSVMLTFTVSPVVTSDLLAVELLVRLTFPDPGAQATAAPSFALARGLARACQTV